MKAVRCGLIFWPALLVALATTAQAQRDPRVGYIYPAGGQVGTSIDAIIGGQYLNGATTVYISGGGVQAVVTPFDPLITGKQATELRERLQELRKKEKDPAAAKEIMEIRRKLAAFQKTKLTPALAETIPVRITIAPNAAPGNRELRLATVNGLSNPLVFQVGQQTEFREPEPSQDDIPQSVKQSKNPRPGKAHPAGTNAPATSITLPAIVNGQIMPGEVDRYRFPARQGQHLVVVVSARELIPYLADAVPGWFQAKVVLYDGQGRELAYSDDYRFHPDPVLFYTIPKNADYLLEIKDTLYRGREDFVYRLAVGELPFVVNLFPLGGKVGATVTLAIQGWNLPANKQTLDLTGAAPGLYPVTIRARGAAANTLPISVDTLPECLQQGPCNSPTNAQCVTLPIIINGRIDPPGTVNVFQFDGHTGDQIVAEVLARRLDSPLDSVLKLTDATGQQLAFNDDHEDKGTGLNTHHADSYLTATLPAAGTYYLYLWDAQQKGGPAYGYRLRLSAPRPDFELRAGPTSLSARPGGSVPINVYALRRDGFTNAIAVALKDAPAGFKLSSGSLIGTQEQIKVTLSIPPTTQTIAYNLTLEGRAQVQDQTLVHPAVPADDMMQAFAYRHLVPAKELRLLVTSRPPPKSPEKKKKNASPTPPAAAAPAVKIPTGGTARIEVKLPTTDYSGKLQLELEEPPEGITIKSFAPTRAGVEIVFQSDATNLKPGQKGELTVKAYAKRAKFKQSPDKPRQELGTLPTIAFTIVAP